MKANELSVGDWVCATLHGQNGKERLTPPMRVTAIGEAWVQLLAPPESGYEGKFPIEDIQPVPLSPEILERNGFVKTGATRACLVYNLVLDAEEDAVLVKINKFSSRAWIAFAPMSWSGLQVSVRKATMMVHELQHVLRLAGIDKEISL